MKNKFEGISNILSGEAQEQNQKKKQIQSCDSDEIKSTSFRMTRSHSRKLFVLVSRDRLPTKCRTAHSSLKRVSLIRAMQSVRS